MARDGGAGVNKDQRITALECDTEVCDHMRPGEPHPKSIVNREGRRFWVYQTEPKFVAQGVAIWRKA